MVAAFLCFSGERALSLDDLAQRHFNHVMIPIEGLIGKKGKEQRTFAEVSQEDACRYGAEDADFTRRLWDVLRKEMEAKGQSAVFADLEMALLPVLLRMEGKGVQLNGQAFTEMAETLRAETERLVQEIHASVGHEFNVASPMQLQQVLFNELGLKPSKKTKTGFSTDAEVLERLEGDHPVISMLLDHRESTKLLNTYVEALPALVDPISGRLHTTYSQVVAATGRLSSLNPNLQNIPIRTEAGRRIRAGFVAPAGRVLLAADYSQIELRLLAHLSGDPALIDAYREGVDIHARTAAALYKVEEADVTAEMRRSSKVVNFGVLYGMGSMRLSQQLKIPRDEAKRFIENYFARFARVRGYIEETVDAARRQGYVETLSGRRRYLPELYSDNRPLRENAERMAVNTPIQGSAADLIKRAMVAVDAGIRSGEIPCDMLLQVHDELVFECAEADAERVAEAVRREMEGAMELSVPLRVELGWAKNWLEAKA
jgi:DNA polymerase-1